MSRKGVISVVSEKGNGRAYVIRPNAVSEGLGAAGAAKALHLTVVIVATAVAQRRIWGGFVGGNLPKRHIWGKVRVSISRAGLNENT